MFKKLSVNEQIEIGLIECGHEQTLSELIDANRVHLRRWIPYIGQLRSVEEVKKVLISWERQRDLGASCRHGIWYQGNLCGMIECLNIDLENKCTCLSYWLEAGHEGKGIMTACCKLMIWRVFNSWNFNRVSIECATDNIRSRAIPERLGFKMEGIIREVEWLHDHYADHVLYGLLQREYRHQIE